MDEAELLGELVGLILGAVLTMGVLIALAVVMARRKRRSVFVWVVLTILFTLPLLVLLALPPIELTEVEKNLAEKRMPCPDCAERIKIEAKICPFCRKKLPEDFAQSLRAVQFLPKPKPVRWWERW